MEKKVECYWRNASGMLQLLRHLMHTSKQLYIIVGQATVNAIFEHLKIYTSSLAVA